MPLALTCTCGARFELEDILAGQTVTCPECQQPLKAPALQQAPLRTSNLALASVVLALVGAFTLVGTAVAALLGFMALVDIGRHRDRVAGVGLALFGIIAGLGLTALTGFALFGGEVFVFAGSIREAMLAEQVDTSGDREIIDRDAGFKITRPSKKWGVAVNKDIEDPFVQGLLHKDVDLLLVHTTRYVFVDVRREQANGRNLDAIQKSVLAEFEPEPPDPLKAMNARPFRARGGPFAEDADAPFKPQGHTLPQVRNFALADDNGEAREVRVEVKCSGRTWSFLIHLMLTKTGKVYVVRAFAPSKKTFQAAEPDFKLALDSFRILPEN